MAGGCIKVPGAIGRADLVGDGMEVPPGGGAKFSAMAESPTPTGLFQAAIEVEVLQMALVRWCHRIRYQRRNDRWT